MVAPASAAIPRLHTMYVHYPMLVLKLTPAYLQYNEATALLLKNTWSSKELGTIVRELVITLNNRVHPACRCMSVKRSILQLGQSGHKTRSKGGQACHKERRRRSQPSKHYRIPNSATKFREERKAPGLRAAHQALVLVLQGACHHGSHFLLLSKVSVKHGGLLGSVQPLARLG